MHDYEDILCHYGTPRHSGRYPYGSGENPYQRENRDFLGRYKEMNDARNPDGSKMYTELDIAKALGYNSTTELRAAKTIAKREYNNYNVQMVRKLREKGMSNVAIGERLGLNESTVRMYLSEGYEAKNNNISSTADMLKDAISKDKYIDVGKGVERYLGVSSLTKDTAIKMLEQEGYSVINLQVKQLSTGQYTTQQIIAPPGTTYKELKDNMDKIQAPGGIGSEYLANNGSDKFKIHRPKNVSKDRILVKYDEDGGTLKDGVIELRRGVKELDMGNSRYAQVRIGVDGDYYLKGMAVYSDDIPDGYDIIFNSNKKRGTSIEKVFKVQNKNDPDNPFGSSIDRQNDWTDEKGNVHEGVLNIVREEGAWGEWKKSIASQVLSKQSAELAKKQLGLAYNERKEEFEKLKSITNPVLRSELIIDFADQCDKDAVDLKAAAFPRQASQVILPVNSLKENEIYAPRYKDGEEVVLIRYPHGGIFEIPRLKVNNRNKEADSFIGKDARDAVGINSKTAEQLSGADFDGDTVLVIPTSTVKIKNKAPLEELKGFDPKKAYPAYEGMKRMGTKYGGVATDMEMGRISNLITDMTLQGADNSEIARAVKHSMVVIDAEKHYLDYKRSYQENGIAALKEKYQGGANKGASTLISKAKSQEPVVKRDSRYSIDPTTGEKIYRPAKDANYNVDIELKDGSVITETRARKQMSTKMAEAKDAYELVGTDRPVEKAYADYANSMKALGNKARLETLKIKMPAKDRSAEKTYATEVESIKNKIAESEKHAPLERKAQRLANIRFNAIVADNPTMDSEEQRKSRNLQLQKAREEVGASRYDIEITPKEWEAIQANAVSASTQKTLYKKTDQDKLMSLALPKSTPAMTNAQISAAKAMLNAGFTIQEVADRYGVSSSTLVSNVDKKEK